MSHPVSYRSHRSVSVLLDRLSKVELPPSLLPLVEKLRAEAPVLAEATLASSQAGIAQRAALAEVRRTAAQLDALLEPLALALVAHGIGTLRAPFGPAGGTIARMIALRPASKVEAVRALLSIVRDHGLDDEVERVADAVGKLDQALVLLSDADDVRKKASLARDSAVTTVRLTAAKVRRVARVLLPDAAGFERVFDAGSAALRPSRRRKGADAVVETVTEPKPTPIEEDAMPSLATQSQ